MSKLEKLSEAYGMTIEEMLKQSVMDGCSPAICMKEGCDYTTDMEPDQERGYCDECGANSMKSVCIIVGII